MISKTQIVIVVPTVFIDAVGHVEQGRMVSVSYDEARTLVAAGKAVYRKGQGKKKR